MKNYLLGFLCFVSSIFVTIAQEQTAENFALKNGDIIFQEACFGSMDDAIKDVTTGLRGYSFTHVGMVWIDSLDQVFVVEAIYPKVKVTPIAKYLVPKGKESCPPVSVVGRLKDIYQPLIPAALREAMRHVGKPYDVAFDLKNDEYYCSELVYIAFLKANNGKEVFTLNPMTFKSSESDALSPYWVNHFKRLGIPVPEGESGINPGGMSTEEVIDIVYVYPRG